MKTVKSALLGARRLTGETDEDLKVEFASVVNEHRQILLKSLLRDVPTYMDYKFPEQWKKLKKDRAELATDKLNQLKGRRADMQYFARLESALQINDVVHLTNEPFYKEIDEWVYMNVLLQLRKHDYTKQILQ